VHYRTLGRTGVQVSSLVLGAMDFGSLGRAPQDEVTAMVDAALEAGINAIDTATGTAPRPTSERATARPDPGEASPMTGQNGRRVGVAARQLRRDVARSCR
jgi:hypothetical protein